MSTEITATTVKKVYGCGANTYESIMHRYWEFDRQSLIDSLELKDGDRVLEVGVGTGKNFPYYPKTAEVVGIDFTEEMLRLAEQKKEVLHESSITIHHMDAEQMDFGNSTFDAALESFVLCVVPDVVKAFKEIIRVTKPGAKIAIFDYCKSRNPDIVKWQELISTSAITIGFPPGVIVWDPLRDYEKVIKTESLPLKIIQNDIYENQNPFLIACKMLLVNNK